MASALNSKTPYMQMKEAQEPTKFSVAYPSKNLQILPIKGTLQKVRAEYNDSAKKIGTGINRVILVEDNKLRYTLHIYDEGDVLSITTTGPSNKNGTGTWKRVERYTREGQFASPLIDVRS